MCVGPEDVREASVDEKNSLYRLGAIITKAQKVHLVSLKGLHAALSRMRDTENFLAPILSIPQLPKHIPETAVEPLVRQAPQGEKLYHPVTLSVSI